MKSDAAAITAAVEYLRSSVPRGMSDLPEIRFTRWSTHLIGNVCLVFTNVAKLHFHDVQSGDRWGRFAS